MNRLAFSASLPPLAFWSAPLLLGCLLAACGGDDTDDANAPLNQNPMSPAMSNTGGSMLPTNTGANPPMPTMSATNEPGPGSMPPGGAGGMPGMDLPMGSGGEMGEQPEPPPANVPADDSIETIKAFMSASMYKGDGWNQETETPREAAGVTSPHGRVIVYLNDILVASLAAGNGGIGAASQMDHTTGSMAVKEMYNESDVLVGTAALFKGQDGGNETWTMYCWAEEERCTAGVANDSVADPMVEKNAFACGACHGGNIFTTIE